MEKLKTHQTAAIPLEPRVQDLAAAYLFICHALEMIRSAQVTQRLVGIETQVEIQQQIAFGSLDTSFVYVDTGTVLKAELRVTPKIPRTGGGRSDVFSSVIVWLTWSIQRPLREPLDVAFVTYYPHQKRIVLTPCRGSNSFQSRKRFARLRLLLAPVLRLPSWAGPPKANLSLEVGYQVIQRLIQTMPELI